MAAILSRGRWVNIFRPEQNVWHVADNGIKCIFLSLALSHRFFWIWLGFIPDEPIENNSALVQLMAWCRIRIEYLNQCWTSGVIWRHNGTVDGNGGLPLMCIDRRHTNGWFGAKYAPTKPNKPTNQPTNQGVDSSLISLLFLGSSSV